ncbi:hypothetical protein MMC31_003772, partial [Peltigera leucophlebia]|nr:hypothetical protein [Peltigera leucophlebia]
MYYLGKFFFKTRLRSVLDDLKANQNPARRLTRVGANCELDLRMQFNRYSDSSQSVGVALLNASLPGPTQQQHEAGRDLCQVDTFQAPQFSEVWVSTEALGIIKAQESRRKSALLANIQVTRVLNLSSYLKLTIAIAPNPPSFSEKTASAPLANESNEAVLPLTLADVCRFPAAIHTK